MSVADSDSGARAPGISRGSLSYNPKLRTMIS